MDIEARLLDYGARIVRLTEALPRTLARRRIGDQLLRCGTSAGANYEEARGAESHEDFLHKLQVSLKELRESNYWLRLLAHAKVVPEERLKDIIDESNQLEPSCRRRWPRAKERRAPAQTTFDF